LEYRQYVRIPRILILIIMRDLNIPRIDEVPDVSAGEGLFSTDVNSQSALSYANGAEQTVLDPTQANANPTIDPAFLAYLMESQKNVAPSNTTLPPNYYYPDANRGVTVGQMSGPLGSMSLITPGAPLFPMSVMDAVEKEEKASKAKWLEDQLKPWDIKYYTIDHKGLNDEFKKFQDAEWKDFSDELLVKGGNDYSMARKIGERDGLFKKKAMELEVIRDNINATHTAALKVISAFESGDRYTDQKSYDAANRWMELVSAGNFKENYDEIQNVRKELVTAVSMSDASKDLLAGVNATVVDNPRWNSSIYDENGKPVATSIDKLVENIKSGGLAVYYGKEGMEELNKKIDASWDASYGSSGAKLEYMPSKEKYRNYFLSIAESSITKNLQHIKNTDQYNRANADKNASQTIINPTTRKFTVGGKTYDARVIGLGYGAGIKGGVVGGFQGVYFDPITLKYEDGANAKGNIVGRIEGEDEMGNTVVFYEVVDTSPNSTTPGKIRTIPSNTEMDGAYQEYLEMNNVKIGETQEYQSGTGEDEGVTRTVPAVTNKPAPARPLPRPY
jgi:hypothetical protein